MAGRAPKVLLHPALAALVSISLGLPAAALAEDAEPPTPTSIVAESEPAEWVEIAPDDLLVIELAPDAAGRPGEVVIQLLPPPFSPG